MNGRARAFAALAFGASVAACVLSIDPLPSTPAPEAGTPTAEASVGQPDGATPDATSSPDGSSPSPCLSPHVFCADFDGPSLADNFEYTEISPDGGVSINADGTWWVSSPRAARVVIDPFSGAPRYARLGVKNKLPHFTNHVRYAYDLRLESSSAPGDGSFEPLIVVLQNTSGTYELSTVLQELGARATEFVDANHYEPHAANVATLTLHAWSHVVIDVDLGATAMLTFTVDGNVVLPKTALKFPFDARDVTLSISTGLEYAPGPLAQKVDYAIDNVVLDGN